MADMAPIRRTLTAQSAGCQACVEAAHGLKGNLLNLGLPELAAAAQAILDKAREGGYQSLQTGHESLAAALAPLLARRAK